MGALRALDEDVPECFKLVWTIRPPKPDWTVRFGTLWCVGQSRLRLAPAIWSMGKTGAEPTLSGCRPYPHRGGILLLARANRHDRFVRGRFTRDDLVEPSPPCVERLALLGIIAVPVIDRRDAGLDVVQNF